MKKYLALFLCVIMMFAMLTACKLKEEPADVPDVTEPNDPEQTTQIPNPMIEVESPEAFQLGGYALTPPADSTDIVCHYISDYAIGQVKFTYNGHEFCYRASTSISDLLELSGVYDEFKDEAISIEIDDKSYSASVEIKTSEEGGRLASWSLEPVNFSLFTPDEISDDEIKAIVINIVNTDLPITAKLLTQK